jgi:hypothetical protein
MGLRGRGGELKRPLPSPEEFMRARIEGCRRGGQKTAARRLLAAKRTAVECAIADHRRRGTYDHNAASRIASYLKVSPRYVRMLAAEKKEEMN